MTRNFKIEALISIFIILFGIYLAFTSGYGSDEDTLPMIGVFQGILKNGIVMSSRFTGYPIPELGIGFLSHYLGSWAANFTTFIFFISGIIFFYHALDTEYNKENFITFFLICLSSPVLFFDNIEPIDYSWAFLFYSIGIFCLKKNFFEIAILFFGFCIGTRINFTPFVMLAIFLFNYDIKIINNRKVGIFLCSFVVGGLFYLTIWYQNSFSLEWLTSARPIHQGFAGLIARFFYKSIMAIGPFFLIFLFFATAYYLKIPKKFKNFNLVTFIIIINLLIFLYIPAELSYLQPMLISLYYLINKLFDKKVVYILIFLNLFTWLIDFNFLEVNYKRNNNCDNVEAISAKINFKFTQGKLNQFYETRDRIVECWIKDEKRGEIIKKGGALKNY